MEVRPTKASAVRRFNADPVGIRETRNSVSLPKAPSVPESLLKAESNLKELASAAQKLNVISDEFTNQVSAIETTLNRLGLGVRAHVIVYSSENMYGDITKYLRLAYGKTGGKWGFVIEQYTDDQNLPDFTDFESWPFKDAPRELRIDVVEKIPELLQALVKKSADIAAKMTQKIDYTKELAARLAPASPQGSKK
jgi:hypothetical protein